MLAKLIAYGEDRDEALTIMKRALSEFGVGGVKTNVLFQYDLLQMEEVIKGQYDTSTLSDKMVKKNA